MGETVGQQCVDDLGAQKLSRQLMEVDRSQMDQWREMEPPFVMELAKKSEVMSDAMIYLTLSNLSKVKHIHDGIANEKDSREAFIMLTQNGDTAYKWLQQNRATMVVTFAPKMAQQWTAVADGLRT